MSRSLLGCLALAPVLVTPTPPASGQAEVRGAPHPRPAITREVAGLQQPAEILIDRHGVAHPYAANEDDLFFVQGWNAARDRLWQLDPELLPPEFVALAYRPAPFSPESIVRIRSHGLLQNAKNELLERAAREDEMRGRAREAAEALLAWDARLTRKADSRARPASGNE